MILCVHFAVHAELQCSSDFCLKCGSAGTAIGWDFLAADVLRSDAGLLCNADGQNAAH
jgi:hypothetical protein